MSVNNTINWFESAAYDHPELHSPQPCPRGVFCQYKIKNPKTGELELACCRMVHPGEEGTGERRMFSRATSIPLERCATVRLTGGATFYERRHKKMSWRLWATNKGIPLPPVDQPWEPVKRVAFQPKPFPPKRRTNVKKDLVPLCAKPEGQEWPAMLTRAAVTSGGSALSYSRCESEGLLSNEWKESVKQVNEAQEYQRHLRIQECQESFSVALEHINTNVPLGMATCGGALDNTTGSCRIDSMLEGLKYEELRCEVFQEVEYNISRCVCITGQCAPYTKMDGSVVCVMCLTKTCAVCIPRMKKYAKKQTKMLGNPQDYLSKDDSLNAEGAMEAVD